MKRLFLLLLSIVPILSGSEVAYVTAPVVDLIGSPLAQIKKNFPFITSYASMPYSFLRGSYCPRIFQLIFNEQVRVIEKSSNQLLIEIPHAFYQTAQSEKKHHKFWAPADAFITASQLKNMSLGADLFPRAIDFSTNTLSSPHEVTLIEPFTDSVTTKIYSAGTRFIKKGSYADTIEVYAYDPVVKQIRSIAIPKNVTLAAHPQKNKREQFLTILRQWAQPTTTIIPYVWGGGSYTSRCTTTFNIKNALQRIRYIIRASVNTPIAGMDCSSLILRAAQLAHMPFFYRNTTTIAKNLQRITSLKTLANGDLIWYRGHVMVVSDKEQNLLIEAASYSDGYGYIHQIPLEKAFKGIKDYEQLMRASNQHQKLTRLKKDGTASRSIYDLTFFKLV